MNIYFSGAPMPYEYFMIDLFKLKDVNKLLSYHYSKHKDVYSFIRKCAELNCQTNIMIDSGAFTVWTKEEVIDIQEYLDYIKSLNGTFYFVNLDHIPGKPNVQPTQEEVLYSIKKGFENYYWFKERGIETIHVFHQGEDFRILDKMIEEMDYIGISPRKTSSQKDRMQWLDDVYDHICDEDGNAKVKTHGFAATGESMMRKYPWYSVDSVSYRLVAAFGNIITPMGIYTMSTVKIDDPNHVNNIDSNKRKLVAEYIESIGFTIEDTMVDDRIRAIINMKYYLDIQEDIRKNPPKFKKEQKSLFESKAFENKIDDFENFFN